MGGAGLDSRENKARLQHDNRHSADAAQSSATDIQAVPDAQREQGHDMHNMP
jgi:cytochrome o ubiquinol oxidase subunit 2